MVHEEDDDIKHKDLDLFLNLNRVFWSIGLTTRQENWLQDLSSESDPIEMTEQHYYTKIFWIEFDS